MTPEIDMSKTYFGDAQDYKFNEITAVIVHADGETKTPDTTAVTVIGEDSDGNVTNAKGTTVPAGEAGYAIGASFIDTDVGTGVHSHYANIGTAAVADWNLLGTIEAGEIEANALAADATGRATMETGFFNTATIIAKFTASSFTDAVVTALFAASSFTKAIVDSVFVAGSIASAKLENPQTFDAGTPAKGVLAVAGNVVEAEEVGIGADLYEFEVVNTDSTDDTQGGEFNNTTDPLTVTISAANYPNLNGTLADDDLVRIENEMLLVTGVAGDDVTFQRGVSNTTNATHADALDIFTGDGVTAGSIAVGLVATLTPAVATPALVADINSRGTESVFATSLQTGAEMLVETADAVGGNIAASAAVLALSENLTQVGSEWDTAALRGGKVAGVRQISAQNYTIDALEVTLTYARISLPFIPLGFIVQVYSSTGLKKEDISDLVTIVDNRIEIDVDGATHIVATDLVKVLAWN